MFKIISNVNDYFKRIKKIRKRRINNKDFFYLIDYCNSFIYSIKWKYIFIALKRNYLLKLFLAYLINWLCYPINEFTWEPKPNLKHLNYLIEEFEPWYPFSVDQNMHNIFCEEVKKKKRAKNKSKNVKNAQNDNKLTTKKRKIECFSDLELNNH